MLCELCGCEEHFNFHHFIPQTLHRNKWFKKNFTPLQLGLGIYVCKECHKYVHNVVPKKKELGRHYNTLEKLLGHPKIVTYLTWKRHRFHLDEVKPDP